MIGRSAAASPLGLESVTYRSSGASQGLPRRGDLVRHALPYLDDRRRAASGGTAASLHQCPPRPTACSRTRGTTFVVTSDRQVTEVLAADPTGHDRFSSSAPETLGSKQSRSAPRGASRPPDGLPKPRPRGGCAPSESAVHRGAHEIGGSCAEVEHERSRVVLDIGLPLDAGSMMSCGYRRLRDWAAAIRR